MGFKGAAVVGLAICCVTATGSSGCAMPPTGPSLEAVALAAPTLRATTGDRGLCCCRLMSVATNRNDVPVNVLITFRAFDSLQREPFASVVYFIPALQPLQSLPVDAPGLLVPCESVDHVLYEMVVKGLTSPRL